MTKRRIDRVVLDDVLNRRAFGDDVMVELQCTQGRHSKRYILHLCDFVDHYTVYAYWGRIGGAVNAQCKYAGQSRVSAERVLQEWVDKKVAPHGVDGNSYRVVSERRRSGALSDNRPDDRDMLEVQVAALSKVANGFRGTFIDRDGMTFIDFIEV